MERVWKQGARLRITLFIDVYRVADLACRSIVENIRSREYSEDWVITRADFGAYTSLLSLEIALFAATTSFSWDKKAVEWFFQAVPPIRGY